MSIKATLYYKSVSLSDIHYYSSLVDSGNNSVDHSNKWAPGEKERKTVLNKVRSIAAPSGEPDCNGSEKR